MLCSTIVVMNRDVLGGDSLRINQSEWPIILSLFGDNLRVSSRSGDRNEFFSVFFRGVFFPAGRGLGSIGIGNTILNWKHTCTINML